MEKDSMTRKSVIKYFGKCYESLQKEFDKSAEGSRQINLQFIYGLGISKPLLRESFLFGWVTGKNGRISMNQCCVIVDEAFVNIWFHPKWQEKRENYIIDYGGNKTPYFVDDSNKEVRDSYEEKFGLRFPVESYYPIGTPDLFIALRGILGIEKEGCSICGGISVYRQSGACSNCYTSDGEKRIEQKFESKMGIEQVKAIVATYNKAKIGTYSSLTIRNTINSKLIDKTFSIDKDFYITLTGSELTIGGGRTIGTHFYKVYNINNIWLEVGKKKIEGQ